MKAPVCVVCERWLKEWPPEREGGGMVSFRDYEPLPQGVVGHSRGDEWFCPDHEPAARELAHLDSASAVALLRKRFMPPQRRFLRWLRSLAGRSR